MFDGCARSPAILFEFTENPSALSEPVGHRSIEHDPGCGGSQSICAAPVYRSVPDVSFVGTANIVGPDSPNIIGRPNQEFQL